MNGNSENTVGDGVGNLRYTPFRPGNPGKSRAGVPLFTKGNDVR
jgi:hypothetical protein